MTALTADELAELRKAHDAAYSYHDNAVEGVQAKRELHALVRERLPKLLAAAAERDKLRELLRLAAPHVEQLDDMLLLSEINEALNERTSQ